MGPKNVVHLQNSGRVVFLHMEDNAYTVFLKWGMYVQRRTFVFLFTFVFTEAQLNQLLEKGNMSKGL
jgi:hypothetical protein